MHIIHLMAERLHPAKAAILISKTCKLHLYMKIHEFMSHSTPKCSTKQN